VFARPKAGISRLARALQRIKHRVTPSPGTIAAGFSSRPPRALLPAAFLFNPRKIRAAAGESLWSQELSYIAAGPRSGATALRFQSLISTLPFVMQYALIVALCAVSGAMAQEQVGSHWSYTTPGAHFQVEVVATGLVAPAGPPALAVAQDDRVADPGRDVLGVPDIER